MEAEVGLLVVTAAEELEGEREPLVEEGLVVVVVVVAGVKVVCVVVGDAALVVGLDVDVCSSVDDPGVVVGVVEVWPWVGVSEADEVVDD